MKSWNWRRGLSLAAMLLLLLVAASSAYMPVASATPDDQVEWSLDLGISFTPREMAEPGWEERATELVDALRARVTARGVSFDALRKLRADGGLDFTFALAAKGPLQLFKQVAYGDLLPVGGGLLGGPVSMAMSGAVQGGETISVSVDTNEATGYSWAVKNLDAAVLRTAGPSQLAPKANLLGAPMKQTIELQALADGPASVELVYRRPWQSTAAPTRHVKLQSARLATMADLVNPAPLEGTEAAQGHQSDGTQAAVGTGSLPSSFSWLDQGKVTPIRDQGGCGSCWAFATVGELEQAIKIKDGVTTDLSEQFLVSCNTDGWSCNGGWWASDYHSTKTVPNDTKAGGVPEAELPYAGVNGTCTAPYDHPYRLDSWSYIGAWNTVASPDAIKSAIYNYGPVGTTVCVGSAFQNYTGGVFSTNETGCGSNKVNHGVVLVGWNDADSTWVLRNSWGSGWGESGYMRITWGTSYVGYASNYIEYTGSGTPPPSYSLTTNTNPNGVGSVTTNPVAQASGQYSSGTTVALTANAPAGYSFSSWSGDASGTANPVSVTMDSNKTVTANFVAAPILVQENTSAVQYGGWSGLSDPNANGGTYRSSNKTSDKVQFKFSGTSVKWITRTGPDQGKATVTIDGSSKGTFDLYSTGVQTNVQKSFGGLASTSHTLIIKLPGTRNALSTGYAVVVDGFIVGSSVTQEDGSKVQLNSWAASSNSSASGGSYRYNSSTGSTVSFTFTGTSVSWMYQKCSSCGQAEVYVDGVDKGKLDLYSSTAKWQVLATYGNLAFGDHTILIKVLGTRNASSTGSRVTVDAFQYSQ